MTRFVLPITLAAGVALTACGTDGAAVSPSAPATSATSRPTADAEPGTASASPGTTRDLAPAWADSLAREDVTIADGTDAPQAEGRSLEIPAGWEAEVWAAVPGARLAAWTPDGTLLVSTGDRGDVVALQPTTDGQAPTETTVLDGLDNPQGLAFADGTTLIVGESTTIASYDYADGAATGRRVLADGLPGGGHASKVVVVDGDRVLFSLGSASNRDPADRESTPERAVVASVPLAGGDHGVIARGVRNGFGLAIAPDGTVWTAVNQSDNQPYPFDDATGLYGTEDRDYINENPVEQVTRVEDGGDLGWPYCVPDARDGIVDLPFVNDPEPQPPRRSTRLRGPGAHGGGPPVSQRPARPHVHHRCRRRHARRRRDRHDARLVEPRAAPRARHRFPPVGRRGGHARRARHPRQWLPGRRRFAVEAHRCDRHRPRRRPVRDG
ncbi:hypothetical protein [Demequina litorisediminis]|uniref:Pyrroloquinoline quinone-dependent pyranose dehydrogenase beta-propeller domain-containing protein n=1 Tax=Demequina litorisediminis TaxID=1849022 RepID=A0ABQ6IC77_9MICO|nr:hypothetical protein [Demequina litorisediminis]GMA34338.1 hypothetical protein GCM10025876_05420 [Demequina litorisediminis]